VVAHDPQNAQPGHRTVRDVLVEVLHPQIDTPLVGNSQIELREVWNQVLSPPWHRGIRLKRVLIVQGLLATRLEVLRVSVELAPVGSLVDPFGCR